MVVLAALGLPGPASVGAKTPTVCHREVAQRFLMRKTYVRNRVLDGRAHARALKWRLDKYGALPDLGLKSDGKEPVSAQVRRTFPAYSSADRAARESGSEAPLCGAKNLAAMQVASKPLRPPNDWRFSYSEHLP